jgi:hypothetical protein
MYIIIKIDGENLSIKKEPEMLYIPFDEGNRHYQEYLKWVAEGNIAEIENITEE